METKTENMLLAFLKCFSVGKCSTFDGFVKKATMAPLVVQHWCVLAALALSSSRPTLVTHSLTRHCFVIVLDSKPSGLPLPNRNLAKLMGVMKKHDLTNKNTTTKTNAKTKTKTMTFRECLQRVIFETFDL